MTHTKDEALKLALEALTRYVNEDDICEGMPGNEPWVETKYMGEAAITAIKQALAEPVQPVAHCEQGPNFCKQCANQQAEDCAAILYRDHNEKPWVHVIQKDLPSGTKLIAVTKGQP
jgi:hypothetical protein